MAVAGIFVVIELEGALAERIHALQLAFDPKMARHLPPHITLIGSSGIGPIRADTPVDALRTAILPIAESTAPITLRFGAPERFVQREIVSLPLDPHGPLRTLHERLATSGLACTPARYPFTPHCTLTMYPTLTSERLKAALAVREPDPFTVRRLRVYLTREPQPARHLFDAPLGGTPEVV
ncbi:MAG: 2'-5' RNA ligase family protein [Gemmatimonadota bacterium]